MSGANQLMSAQEVNKHVKTYLMVFGALLFLTVVTVGVSYLELPTYFAVALGLFVATLKGSLVALFFMHLNHEKKIIYWTIGLTAILFVFVMMIGFF